MARLYRPRDIHECILKFRRTSGVLFGTSRYPHRLPISHTDSYAETRGRCERAVVYLIRPSRPSNNVYRAVSTCTLSSSREDDLPCSANWNELQTNVVIGPEQAMKPSTEATFRRVLVNGKR
ncbi:hypothetical protein QCA50_009744 [Cerrena zonata]|uniref:Uncharacterized protein n=1 Tax=Cerrena zonata TaxID=2478898 RepID=A0AAW0G6A7_9APHY